MYVYGKSKYMMDVTYMTDVKNNEFWPEFPGFWPEFPFLFKILGLFPVIPEILYLFPLSISVRISVKFPWNFRVLDIQFISVRILLVGITVRSISAEHRITEFSNLRIALIQILFVAMYILSIFLHLITFPSLLLGYVFDSKK